LQPRSGENESRNLLFCVDAFCVDAFCVDAFCVDAFCVDPYVFIREDGY